jgi:AmmeMemoRadiSam system protein A
MTTDADRRLLLGLARDALAAHLGGLALSPPGLSETIARRAGAFVSLHYRGQLRGCIGHVDGDETLGSVIARCAVAAATADPRFHPIAHAELPDIVIELSILGALEELSSLADLEIGRHGLIVEMGRRRGLLLPQVAKTWQWDAVTFVAETCRKAGLPPDVWQKGAKLWRFEAEVFSESR